MFRGLLPAVVPLVVMGVMMGVLIWSLKMLSRSSSPITLLLGVGLVLIWTLLVFLVTQLLLGG